MPSAQVMQSLLESTVLYEILNMYVYTHQLEISLLLYHL